MDDTAAAGEGEGEDVLIVDDMCDGDEQIVLSYMDVDEEDCAHQAEDAAAEEVAEEEAAEELEPEVAEDATEEAADEAEEAAQEALADEAAEEAAEGAAEGAAGEGAPGEEEPAAECAEEGGAAAEDAPAGAPDVVVLDDDDEDVGSVEGGGGSPGGGGPVPVSATSALVEAAAPPAVGSGAEGAESPEGFVFVCNAENFGECQRHQLFGAAAWQLKKMKEHITPDTLLFLYNYSTERLYGTFVASGEADMNVVSGAFKGQFNAQVPASPLDDLILEASVPKRLQAGPKSAAEVASILEALQAGRRAAPEVQQAWGIEAPSAPAEEPPHKRPRVEDATVLDPRRSSAPGQASAGVASLSEEPAERGAVVRGAAPAASCPVRPAAAVATGPAAARPPAVSFTPPTPKFTTPRPKWGPAPPRAPPPPWLPAAALGGAHGAAVASPQHAGAQTGGLSPAGQSTPGALQAGMSSPRGSGKALGTYWEDLPGGAPESVENGYVMHCANTTQFEVFQRHLFGGPEREFQQLKQHINPGTTLYLLNFESCEMFGPFCATTAPELNIVREAFHGRFRAQVRVATKDTVLFQVTLKNKVPPGPRSPEELEDLKRIFQLEGSAAPPDVQEAWAAPSLDAAPDSAAGAALARPAPALAAQARPPGVLLGGPQPGAPGVTPGSPFGAGWQPGAPGSPFGMGTPGSPFWRPGMAPPGTVHGGLRPTLSSGSLGSQPGSAQGPASPTNPARGAEQLSHVDSEGRPYNLRQIVVNFANVGAAYASKVLKKDNKRGDRLFDWEGVRKCIKHLKEERGLDVVGVVYENLYGPDNGRRDVNGIPYDIRQLCSSIQETPKLTGKNQRSADDEMTIKCAYKRNCRFMDNDNYRDWLVELRDEKCRRWLQEKQEMLQTRYFFDSELGTFDTLDGNIPMSLLERGRMAPVPSHLVGKC